jgi:hypothetical protein
LLIPVNAKSETKTHHQCGIFCDWLFLRSFQTATKVGAFRFGA